MEILQNAIQIIDKEYTFFNKIMIVYYNILKYFISFSYSCTFLIERVVIDEYICYKERILKIDDNKMTIHDSEIPYEYIMVFTQKGRSIYMEILGTYDHKIIPSNKQLKLFLSFDTKETTLKVCESIKKNMFYHIKYNKLDSKVFQYMQEYENDLKK